MSGLSKDASKTLDDFMSGLRVLGQLLGSVLAGLLILFSWGYCLSIIWDWLAVPRGLPAIGIIEAAIAALVVRGMNSRPEPENLQAKAMGYAILAPWETLFFAYVALWVVS